MTWLCCQIGAREHYAVPRALNRIGELELLLTDVWCSPRNPLGMASENLRERYHGELAKSRVIATNLQALGFELKARLFGLRGWARMAARNIWFQEKATAKLSMIGPDKIPRILFAYSHAARRPFQVARERGWRTVLGQIDAGPVEDRIVARLHAENPALQPKFEAPPATYWDEWREECALADRIVVNSVWSQTALEDEGIPSSKIRIIPLTYEGPVAPIRPPRAYPDKFMPSRPLRVLFLGNICLRKGIGPLFDAIGLMRGAPIEFWFVGEPQVSIPPELQFDSRVRWIGSVARSETAKYYRDADVFILPTFSDGFGLTQLEAQASGLPVIASRNCGNVVKHGWNGLLLRDICASEIVETLDYLVANPSVLAEMSANATKHMTAYSLDCAARNLQNIF